MKKIFLAFSAMWFLSNSAHATILDPSDQLPVNQTTVSKDVVQPPLINDRYNAIGMGILGGTLSGVAFTYNRALTNHWAIGLMQTLPVLDDRLKSDSGGDLSSSQYYENEISTRSWLSELNVTYYLRDNGFRRWGVFFTAGAGYEQNEAKGEWGQYGPPDWFAKLFGGTKSEIASGGTSEDWSTAYGRLGAGYQFVFARSRSHFIMGHVIELGATAIVREHTGSISYVEPSGAVYSGAEDAVVGAAMFNYRMIF